MGGRTLHQQLLWAAQTQSRCEAREKLVQKLELEIDLGVKLPLGQPLSLITNTTKHHHHRISVLGFCQKSISTNSFLDLSYPCGGKCLHSISTPYTRSVHYLALKH